MNCNFFAPARVGFRAGISHDEEHYTWRLLKTLMPPRALVSRALSVGWHLMLRDFIASTGPYIK